MIQRKKPSKTVKQRKYVTAELDMIQTRAYYIWEQNGCPENSALENWIQAEQELLKEGRL